MLASHDDRCQSIQAWKMYPGVRRGGREEGGIHVRRPFHTDHSVYINIRVIPYKSTEKNMTIFFWIFDQKSQKLLIF